MKKIKEEHLKEIVALETKLNKLFGDIGVLETQKHVTLHTVATVNKDLEDLKTVLEKEYGKVHINLETGEYTNIEEDE